MLCLHKCKLNDNLQYKLDNLPQNPGVYLYRNTKGKVIYVGKAKVLRNRVRSYFTGIPDGRAQFEMLVENIDDVEVIITDTEVEALILEATLIKKFHPRFNIFLRDDKFFPFLKVTKELFPRAYLTRKVVKDGSAYHGPFTEVKQVKYLIKTFKGAFKIRNCNLDITEHSIEQKKHKICLDYHIKICGGPCEGRLEAGEYNANVKKLVALVKGDVGKVISDLKREMSIASESLRFEYAAQLRDQLRVAEEFAARQTIIFGDNIDRDVFGLTVEDDDGCAAVFKVRSGRVQGREQFFLKGVKEQSTGEIMSAVLEQYYFSAENVPREIFLQFKPAEEDLITEWLKGKRGGVTELIVPQRGKKLKLLNLAKSNAELLLGEKIREKELKERIPYSLVSLKETLKMSNLPRRIEAFDISHIQGSQTVGSLVVFKDGKPLKSDYRKFNIKSVKGVDDFASMAEVVRRRYKRAIDEKQDMPDLILIDGGKGQLSCAVKSLRELGIEGQPIIGLAKRLEEIYLPENSEPINIPKTSSALKLLQQVRDEAHRSAVTHHRQRRQKATIASILDNVPGVGERRKKFLLKKFGSIRNISSASLEELNEVAGIDKTTAESIFQYFKQKNLQV